MHRTSTAPDDHATPPAGRPEWLAPGLRRILAPNPSPMTERGTNTYLVGDGGGLALIDPGPAIEVHAEAILGALAPGEHVSHILVTHAHHDHSSLAPIIAARTGAPVLAFGPADAGRNPRLIELARTVPIGGGEGVDAGFRPDRTLPDGAVIAGAGWRLTALHTPGHFGNHLCFLWGEAVFSGDLAMGWASSLVSPPDGDMAAYMASLGRLAGIGPAILYPGHGAAVTDAPARLEALATHRSMRERQILGAIADGAVTIPAIRAGIYRDTPAPLWPAAERNILSHLFDLMERNIIDAPHPFSLTGAFRHR